MSADSECTQCHLLWLPEFERPAGDILVPYQRGADFASGLMGAESTDLMCYSCHDGYVEDSRARTRLGYQHPMAAISRLPRQQRPVGVRLLNEETVYCGTCHTPHGPGQPPAASVQLERNPFLRLAPQPGSIELCVRCHDYVSTSGAEIGNHPLGHPEFQVPRVLRQFYSIPTPQGGIGCETCHNLHGAANRLMVIRGGDEGSSITHCRSCHGDDYTRMGLGRFSHPTTVALQLGTQRPDREGGDGAQKFRFPNGDPVRLTAAGNMNCFTCHDVHESAGTQSILRAPAVDDSFCATCHAWQVEGVAGTSHDLNIRAPEARNLLDETVAEAGMCSACHVVHKARNVYLWSRTTRTGQHVIDRLCLSCHAPGGIATTVIKRQTVHPTEIDKSLIRQTAGEQDVALTVPLFDRSGREADRGSITCATCHDAHHWDSTGKSQPPYPPTGYGTAMNSFLRLRSEDQICKYCHGVSALWRYKYWHNPEQWRKQGAGEKRRE
jgi:predicted CXXCH cytochrome family protein